MIFQLKHKCSGGQYRTITPGDRLPVAVTVLSWGELNSLCNQRHEIDSFEGKRVQRRINKSRARKFADYLYDRIKAKKRFIIPPIIMTILPPDDDYYASIGVDVYAEDYKLDKVMPYEMTEYSTNECKEAHIEAGSIVVINDGQHRVMGIRMLINRLGQMKRKEEKLEGIRLNDTLFNQVIVQVQCCFTAEPMQQYFADINSNAAKPSRSISLFFDKTNEFNASVNELVEKSEVLKGRVDFDRNMPSGKSGKVFGFAGLVAMVDAFFPEKNCKEGLDSAELQCMLDVFNTLGYLWSTAEQTAEQLREGVSPHLVFLKGLMRYSRAVCDEHLGEWREILGRFIPSTKETYVHRCTDAAGRMLTKAHNEQLVSAFLKDMQAMELSPAEEQAEHMHTIYLQQLADAETAKQQHTER